MSNEEAILDELKKQNESLYALRKDLRSVSKKGKRTWKILIVDIIATVLATTAIWVSVTSFERATKADQSNIALNKAQYTSCIDSNQTRDANRSLWAYILNIIPPSSSPEEAQRIAGLKHEVQVAFHDRNCNKLKGETQ